MSDQVNGSTVHPSGERVESLELQEQGLLSLALRALCLTRDYVGEHLLPPIDGWEWYDVGRRIAAAIPEDKWAREFNARVLAWRDLPLDVVAHNAPERETESVQD